MSLNRLGVKNGAAPANWTAETELFQRQYLTEVITAFDEVNVMQNLHMIRRITKAKSATFPVTWKTDAQYFVPGTTGDLDGTNTVKHNEVIIHVDRVLLSDIKVAEIDELMNYWDVRAEYARQQAAALSRKFDKNCLQMVIKAARAAARVTDADTGAQVSKANIDTDADTLISGIFEAVQKLAEKNVPTDVSEIATVLKPAQYYLLAKGSKVQNRDYAGGGSIAAGTVPQVAGSPIVMSNNVPSTNIAAAESGDNNDYSGDFTLTRGVTFHRSAIGSVRLMDLRFESEYLIQKQATLMVVKQAVGHGILRGEGSVELKVPA